MPTRKWMGNMTMGTQRLWNPYESNATTDHGAWEENYAYNADGYVDENYETAATVDGNEYTQAQSEDNEYHEEQEEFTEGTESSRI